MRWYHHWWGRTRSRRSWAPLLRQMVVIGCPGIESAGHRLTCCRRKWRHGDTFRTGRGKWKMRGRGVVETYPIELPTGEFVQLIDIDGQSIDDGTRNVFNGGLHHLCAILSHICVRVRRRGKEGRETHFDDARGCFSVLISP